MRHEAGVKIGRISITQSSPQVPPPRGGGGGKEGGGRLESIINNKVLIIQTAH